MVELTPDDMEMLTGRNFGTLVTLNEDGSPHASVIWVDAAEGLVLVNTAEGRVKARNLHADPRTTLLVMRDPFDWISIAGRVEGVTGEPEALAHIDALSRRYDGKPWEPVEGQERVVFRIRPERILRYS
ncbi:MAG TPA: PPOX class F420-dependent oxidoreductase [Actinomycetota bacterium]|nr:PPOX class F420-dependent oxidoreductase [Actinomycetota bacterium]